MITDYSPDAVLKSSLNIPYFAYYGEYELGVTHAFMFAVHRDSDLLNQANWQVITKGLNELDPDNLEHDIVPTSHWLVGWMDHIVIKVYDEDNTPTLCFLKMVDYLKQLEDYPILDEELYSNLEWESVAESIESELKYFEHREYLRKKHPSLKTLTWRVMQELNEISESVIPDDKELANYLDEMGYLNRTNAHVLLHE